MEYLTNIGLFALLFFILVFIHELGHFLMAKWVGIRVERFSIGMGPALFSKKWGDTEYRVAALPLGGYVKMAGDDPTKEYSEEEKRVGFLTQKPGAKLLVVFGGPAFNLILPIFVFGIMMMFGIPRISSFVGMVEDESPAAKAGLMSGDRILAVNGEKLRAWDDFNEKIKTAPNEELNIVVERQSFETTSSKQLRLSLTPELGEGKSRFGEDIKVGRSGISPTYLPPRVYFEGDQGPLPESGVQPFDRVVSANGQPIQTKEEWERFLSQFSGQELQLQMQRGSQTYAAAIKLPEGSGDVKSRLGLLPIELVIGELVPGGAAKEVGIQSGDRIVSISGKQLQEWNDLLQAVRGSKGEEVEISWSRGGEMFSGRIQAEKTTIEDPLMGKDNPLAVKEIYRIGVSPKIERETDRFYEQSWSPLAWVSKGFTKTWDLTTMTAEALGKLVTGQLSLKLLGSPIMIYKVAGNTFRLAGGGYDGWISFFTTLAMLSITLGLVNLLPIPILDGGHAVFFTLEAIRGKPVSIRVLEIANQLGLVIILGVFVMVLWNDIDRYRFLEQIIEKFQ